MTGFYIKIQNPIFVYFRKHYCPKCSNRLKAFFANKLVDSDSLEAVKYNFVTMPGHELTGIVNFHWVEFKCLSCGFQIKVSDLKSYEKEQKRIKHSNKINEVYFHK
jgi:RNase P subunit RPR2